MSWEATAYAKKVKRCPDGAEISRGQKFLLLIMADYHDAESRLCFPSIPTLAEDAMCDPSTVKSDLRYLDQHCVLDCIYPERQGRGKRIRYVFLELDAPDRLRQKLNALAKGMQNSPLFSTGERGEKGVEDCAQRGEKGVRKGWKRGESEPRKSQKTKEVETLTGTLTGTREQEHSTPDGALGVDADAVGKWLAIKEQLRSHVTAEEWHLWVRPARLLTVLSGVTMMIAVPPSNQIMQAIHGRKDLLIEMAVKSGFRGGVALTRYPDDWQKQQFREQTGRGFIGDRKRT